MNILGKFVAGAATAVVLVAPLGLASPAYAAKDYANCDAMHRDYKHGVAKSKRAARKQVNDGYGRPAVRPKVYRANRESDADDDGTACEA
jgi:hypothetical protein